MTSRCIEGREPWLPAPADRTCSRAAILDLRVRPGSRSGHMFRAPKPIIDELLLSIDPVAALMCGGASSTPHNPHRPGFLFLLGATLTGRFQRRLLALGAKVVLVWRSWQGSPSFMSSAKALLGLALVRLLFMFRPLPSCWCCLGPVAKLPQFPHQHATEAS